MTLRQDWPKPDLLQQRRIEIGLPLKLSSLKIGVPQVGVHQIHIRQLAVRALSCLQ